MSVNNFGLFFTRDGTVIRLPVNPEKLPVARDNDNSEYNVLGIGPIMIPRIPKLREVTISSFFPGREFSGSNQWGAFHPPEYYIQFFESAMNDKAPIIYTPVVTQFNTEERGGETGDFYYDLTLTEYRDYTPQSLSAQSGRQPAGMPVEVTAEPSRTIPQGQLYAGAACIANGSYFYTSYGDEPHGTASGRRVLVSRIVDATRPASVHITDEAGNPLGWIDKNALQVVSDT